MTEIAFDYALGLGSNIGDGPEQLKAATDAIARAGITVVRASRAYRTPPWGDVDQPDFTNACLLVTTERAPESLLAEVKAIEAHLGRQPTRRWGPRVIDIDLLWWKSGPFKREGLTLPHPEMMNRPFVLIPLAEIAPSLIIGGKSLKTWAAEKADDTIRPLEQETCL